MAGGDGNKRTHGGKYICSFASCAQSGDSPCEHPLPGYASSCHSHHQAIPIPGHGDKAGPHVLAGPCGMSLDTATQQVPVLRHNHRTSPQPHAQSHRMSLSPGTTTRHLQPIWCNHLSPGPCSEPDSANGSPPPALGSPRLASAGQGWTKVLS